MKHGENGHIGGTPKPDGSDTGAPIHPGCLLRRKFFDRSGITQAAFARRLGVSRRTLYELFWAKRPVTRRTAKKLDAKLEGAPVPWLQLQARYDDWRNGGQHRPPPGQPPTAPGSPPPAAPRGAT